MYMSMSEGEANLYDVLGLPKDASQEDIKKAFRKLALRLHPDKNPGDEHASAKFQSLQRIYSILNDPARRKVYDQTGSISGAEGLAGEDFDNLYQYFRGIYREVTEADIEDFASSFRGSHEEAEEVMRYYARFKGDMQQVFQWVMCSEERLDAHRFRDIILAAVQEGRAKHYKAFKPWSERVAALPAPRQPLARRKGMEGSTAAGSEQLLVAQIRGSEAARTGALAALEAKYCKQRGIDGKRRVKRDKPSEEDFAAAALRLTARRDSQGKTAKKKKGGIR